MRNQTSHCTIVPHPPRMRDSLPGVTVPSWRIRVSKCMKTVSNSMIPIHRMRIGNQTAPRKTAPCQRIRNLRTLLPNTEQEGRFASPPTGEDSIIFPLQQEGRVDSSPAAPTSQIDWVFQEDWIAVGVPCQSQGRVSLNPDWEDEQAEEITSLPSEEERIPSTHPYEENNNPDPECSSEGTHPFAVDDREEDITEDNEGLTQTILLTPETHHMVPLTPMPMGSETTYRLKFAEQKVHYYIPTPTMKVTFLPRHLRTMHNTEPAKNRTSKQGYIYRRCPVDACGKTVARLRLHLRRMYAIQEADSLRSLIGRAEILTKDSSDEQDVQ